MAVNHGNYIHVANRFGLETPPDWWLTKLHDQDAALVVFPSQGRPNTYVLARRRSHRFLQERVSFQGRSRRIRQ